MYDAMNKGLALATGEIVGTESDDLLSSIEALTLTGKKQGRSDIELRAGYTVSGQTKWLSTKLRVTVSGTNIQRESSASTAFGEDMLYREKRTVRDAPSGKSREYVFVEPEDDASYQASIGIWKLAQETFDDHLANLVIAQLVFLPVARAALRQVDEFELSARGEGGFGHTGTR